MAGIDNVTGSIEKGKSADMIVTEKNPLDDIRALRNIDTVIFCGNIINNPKVKVKKKVSKELDKFLY